jgi:uncharacterized protein YjaZ
LIDLNANLNNIELKNFSYFLIEIFYKKSDYNQFIYYTNKLETKFISPILIRLKILSYYYSQNFADALRTIYKYENKIKFSDNFQKFIKKLKSEYSNEIHFLEYQVRDFKIFYSSKIDFDKIKKISEFLNQASSYISNNFGMYQKNEVTVLIYEEYQYKKLSNVPEWSGGLFDGKIRIPINLNYPVDYIKPTVFHEYTHAIHYQYSNGNMISYWFAEGLAKYIENTSNNINYTIEDKKFLKLEEINSTFLDTKISNKLIKIAYFESYLIVKNISERYGKYTFKNIINEFNKTNNLDQALLNEIFVDTNRLFTELEFDIKRIMER